MAETERFSNPRTSPKVMTMSAQLMAAGANQQLIVSKLEPPTPPPAPAAKEEPKPVPAAEVPKEKTTPDGTLSVDHSSDVPATPPVEKDEEVDVKEGEIHIDNGGNIHQEDDTLPLPNPSKSPEQTKKKRNWPVRNAR